MTEKEKKYSRFLYITLAVSVAALLCAWYAYFYEQIPSVIKLKAGMEQTLDLKMPVTGRITRKENIKIEEEAVAVSEQGVSNIPKDAIQMDFSRPVSIKAEQLDHYRMQLKLFGFIPLKDVNVEIVRERYLTPAGIPIGIYVKTKGVLVIGVGEFEAADGSHCSPSKYLLKSGDYIVKLNGKWVESKRQFMDDIKSGNGEAAVLTVRRGTEEFDLKIQPESNPNGEYKLGIWIRDNAQGVGTMTYIDETNHFGALGHGINDVDTSALMELERGTLYDTEIIGIKKGFNGAPGELTGMIEYRESRIRGEINANTDRGIFGTCNEEMKDRIISQALPMGLKQEIVTGPAKIICCVEGEPKYYDVEITEVRLEHDNINRGIVLKVTDAGLLEITGGIVQGMSGAPIIQNGKLIGAVTHVLVQDSASGYGIFIENMVE